MTGLSIRLATLSDAATLAELNGEVQGLHVAERPDQFKVTDPEQVAAWYRQRLEEAGVRIWVAELDAELVGYLLALERQRDDGPFCPARSWWELDQVAVRSRCRRRGVARALIEKALAEARTAGVHEVEFNTWSFNDAAQRAFARFGFKPKVVRFELRLP